MSRHLHRWYGLWHLRCLTCNALTTADKVDDSESEPA